MSECRCDTGVFSRGDSEFVGNQGEIVGKCGRDRRNGEEKRQNRDSDLFNEVTHFDNLLKNQDFHYWHCLTNTSFKVLIQSAPPFPEFVI
jgi:hypothetical protein